MTRLSYFPSGEIPAIVKLISLALMMWIYCGPSYSTPPPPPGNTVWFYRVDTRPPEIIFSEGFSPRGTEHDLVTHFLGYSDQLDNNGFVSVTDSFSAAVEFADSTLRSRESDNIYIYRVGADAGFYNVEYSIRAHVENILSGQEGNGDPLHNYLERIYDGLETFSWEREWITSNTISGSSVRAVSIVRRSQHLSSAYPGLQISLDEESVSNPQFIASNSVGYQSVYPIPIPEEDLDSDSVHSTDSDHSDGNHHHPPDSMAMLSYSGYISVSIIYPGCFNGSSLSKYRVVTNHITSICPGLTNLTKMKRDKIYISTLLSIMY